MCANYPTNGCGPKGGWIRPPQWLFRAPCNDHDVAYAIGGRESDRRLADQQFLRDMLACLDGAPWWSRPWMYVQAYLYYRAVRWCGRRFFAYHI